MANANTKKTFIRFVSHEIRGPLNTISLGLESLHHVVDNTNSSVMLTEVDRERNRTILEIKDACSNAIKVRFLCIINGVIFYVSMFVYVLICMCVRAASMGNMMLTSKTQTIFSALWCLRF